MVYALETLRSAPNDSKAPLLKALESVECRSEDVCELKRTCVAAYEVHLRALSGTRAARRAIEQDAGKNERAAQLLGQSASLLKEAAEKTKRCTELEGEVVRRYALR